jgi:predicted flap endonuclease-1-like 5' DNA nuclease
MLDPDRKNHTLNGTGEDNRNRGIGPAFERVLNKMGIVTFDQVAQQDATALQRLRPTRHVPDRIKRDRGLPAQKLSSEVR